MNLDTYRSTLFDGVFVTLPSIGGKSTIGLLDELSALRLDPVRRGYRFSEHESREPFARFVLTEIVLKGYARHGSITERAARA
jgi:hypothetical protein